MSSYSDKLRDPRWQKKRLEILNAANWECSLVGEGTCLSPESEKVPLHVHHKLYLRNTAPWQYPDWVYQVLCEACHKREQESMDLIHAELAQDQYLSGLVLRLIEMKRNGAEEIIRTLANLIGFRSDMLPEKVSLIEDLERSCRALVYERVDLKLRNSSETAIVPILPG